MKENCLTRTYKAGTRTSPLALKQVEEVAGYLRDAGVKLDIEVIGIVTAGDRDKVTPISDMEGTDFFTREIERALLNKDIDFAVHSAKDLPDIIPEGLYIAAITERIDAYDALVSKNNLTIEKLPQGAKIAASSRRRKEQLVIYRNDFKVVDIRGNIEERLRYFDAADLDAIIIAACALKRLGLENRISQRIPFEILKPHFLQGCLAIETRQDNTELIKALSKIDNGRACYENK
ncbi:MAG: hydroxymethylbilane synthase [Candidatus Omnitrophota bacterium]|nr:hydroxymethylbilane synthase [Candidatus Omnitrophota bacterium]